MTRADWPTFHQTWFKPNHATLIVVGDITMAELTPKLERAFAAWKRGDVPAKNIATVPAPARDQVYIVDRPGAEQSRDPRGAARSRRRGTRTSSRSRRSTTRSAARSRSRVNMNLREDKHWSYGAGSFAVRRARPAAVVVYAPVQTDKTKESVQEVIKELRAVIDDRPITAGGGPGGKGSADAHDGGTMGDGGAIMGGAAGDRDVRSAAGLLRDVCAARAAVTPEAVAGVVGKAVSAQRIAIVVVGDRAVVEAGLKELGLGEPRRLDGDGQPVVER